MSQYLFHSSLLSYWRLLDLVFLLHLSLRGLRLSAAGLFLRPLPPPPLLEVGVEPLQDVDGVVDEQGEPGQAEEDPRGHEDAVPIRECFVWIIVCEREHHLLQSIDIWS